MASMNRIRVTWSGTPVVGGGLSTFYFEPTAGVGAADDIAAFFTAIRNAFPTGITWTIPDNGDELDDVDGSITGVWSDPGAGGIVTSSGTANFANGVGARFVWNTAGIYRGRRVRGSTFAVPLVSGVYLSDGTIDNATVATFQAAATALVAANPGLLVYSRHADADAHHGATVGTSSLITSATAVDKVSWLRTRRT